MIVAGDFNARSYRWSLVSDGRGEAMNEWMEELEMEAVNILGEATFSRGFQTSDIDVTLPSVGLEVVAWATTDKENLSDHKNIVFKVKTSHMIRNEPDARASERKGWFSDKARLVRYASNLKRRIERNKNAFTVAELQDYVIQTCDKTFKRKQRTFKRKNAVYWWSNNIANLRAQCIRSRKRLIRANGSLILTEQEKEHLLETYKQSKKNLNK